MTYKCINLEQVYNWKMINSQYNNQLQFAGARNIRSHMWDGASLPGSNEIIRINNIDFLFPDKTCNKNDAIECEGQIVDINVKNVSNIYMLSMTSDDATCMEKLIINYSDNEFEEQKVLFKEWYYLKSNTKWNYMQEQDKLTVEGMIGRHYSDKSKRCMYLNHIILKGKDVSSIELPFNPDIFIYAITVKGSDAYEIIK